MRLLLVEDDAMIGEAAQQGLRQEGYAVDWVRDGAGGRARACNGVYDLRAAGPGPARRGRPGVLRELRARGNATPVLVLTARDAVADRVAGLDAGADDYLVKPFDLDELAARIRAVLRRRGRARRAAARARRAHARSRRASDVRVKGAPVALSAREFALLQALLERPGAVLSRAQLEERLYGWGEEIGSNAVEVHIHALRKKLGAELIRNVRGVGYIVPKPAAVTSIRRRLLVWLLSRVLAGGLAAAAAVYLQARDEVNEIFDYQLRQLALLAARPDLLPSQLAAVLQGEEALDFVIQVWAPDGTQLYESHPQLKVPGAVQLGFGQVQTRRAAGACSRSSSAGSRSRWRSPWRCATAWPSKRRGVRCCRSWWRCR